MGATKHYLWKSINLYNDNLKWKEGEQRAYAHAISNITMVIKQPLDIVHVVCVLVRLVTEKHFEVIEVQFAELLSVAAQRTTREFLLTLLQI